LVAFLILAALAVTAVYTATSHAERSLALKAAAMNRLNAPLSGDISRTLDSTVVKAGVTTQNFAFAVSPSAACLTDTTQADFESGTLTNVDTTTSPGDVILSGNTATLDQQNTNVTASSATFSSTTWVAQTFAPSVTGQLTRADVDLLCSGCTGTTPDITVSVRAVSAGLPTGADLATATITGFSSSTPTFYTANFATPATLTAGAIYAIVIRADSDPDAGTYGYVFSGGSTYPSGRRVTSINSGSTWTGQTNDIGFKTYMLGGYAASGNLISSVKDANPGAATAKWTTISWSTTTPANTNVTFQVAASNNVAGPFNFVGPDSTANTFFSNGGSLAQFNGNRYLKYKAVLSTTNSAATPILSDVTVCYANSATTTLAVDPAVGTYRGTTTLSATLTDGGGNPVVGRTVSFTLNGIINPDAVGETDSNGVVTIPDATLSLIPAGTYPNGVVANFAGDATYAASSGSNTLTINRAATATSLTSNNNPSAGGEPITFTAIVTSEAGGTPTGTVTFKDGANTLGNGTLNGSGQATLTSSVTQGIHSITAEYNGDSNYDISTSPPLTQTATEPLSTCTNVALASYGATASASSTFGAGYEPSGAIDGNHKGNGWGTGVGWNDGTMNAFPDALTINLGSAQQVNEIYVFSMQDNYLNPSEPTESMTFSLYGLVDFEVQIPDGVGGWVDVPGGNITGNNKVRRRVIFASPVMTDQIRIVVNSTADNIWSRVVEVEAYSCSAPAPTPTPTPTICTTNVAAASYGATASASSEAGPGYAASGVIDGNRAATNWGTGTGWNDGTAGAFPDSVVVNFGINQSISEVDVYSLQDNYTSPVEPTDSMTFNYYGLTDFQVQIPDGGSGWVDVPGGHVTGNNLVKRRVVLASPVVTDRIRILVNSSADGVYSRIAEVEAFSCTAAPGPTPTPTPTPCTTNVAASSYGATASASSTVSPNYPAAGAIDGNHTGAGWGTGVGWNDATAGVYPDSLTINLNATQAVSEVDVYSLQDNYASPIEPTDTTTFTYYGLTDFQVQVPDGVGGWVDVPGGHVTGNNLVRRRVVFASPVMTNQIRIQVNNTADAVYSRIVEVEAFSCTPVAVALAPTKRSGSPEVAAVRRWERETPGLLPKLAVLLQF
jgi:hypothetical protein